MRQGRQESKAARTKTLYRFECERVCHNSLAIVPSSVLYSLAALAPWHLGATCWSGKSSTPSSRVAWACFCLRHHFAAFPAVFPQSKPASSSSTPHGAAGAKYTRPLALRSAQPTPQSSRAWHLFCPTIAPRHVGKWHASRSQWNYVSHRRRRECGHETKES